MLIHQDWREGFYFLILQMPIMQRICHCRLISFLLISQAIIACFRTLP